jgi:phosphatidylglycerophosphate synthase
MKREYAYKSPTTSVFFREYFKPVYTWIAYNILPAWLHPNVVTLLGLVSALGHFLLIGAYSSWFTVLETVPSWAWITSGLLFLTYATMDNCDGIQARRLGLSSPVGEMLDHGVDSVVACTAALVITVLCFGVTQEDKMHWAMIALCMFMYLFHMPHLISVIRGQLTLGYEYFSIDEIFFLYTAALVIEGLVPGIISATEIYGYKFSESLFWAVVVPGFYLTAQAVYFVVVDGETLGTRNERDSRLYTLVKAFVPLLIIMFSVYYFAPYDAYWFFTWVPVYSLFLLDRVLMHMKEDPLNYQYAFAFVLSVRMCTPAPYTGIASACAASLALILHAAALLEHMKTHYHLDTLFTVPRKR